MRLLICERGHATQLRWDSQKLELQLKKRIGMLRSSDQRAQLLADLKLTIDNTSSIQHIHLGASISFFAPPIVGVVICVEF